MQTVTFIRWGEGKVYRGGVGTDASEPYQFWAYRGASCEEVCGKVWDRHSQSRGEQLKFAHCTSASDGNSELVATTNTYIESMVENMAESRASFIFSCARMRIACNSRKFF